MRNQELSCSTSALWQELAMGNPDPGPPSTTLWIIYLVKPAETTDSGDMLSFFCNYNKREGLYKYYKSAPGKENI